jgi:hypothetical protein
MKKKRTGRKSRKSQVKKVKNNLWGLIRKLIFLAQFKELDPKRFGEDNELIRILDNTTTSIAQLEMLLTKRYFSVMIVALVDDLSGIYTSYKKSQIQFDQMKTDITELFQKQGLAVTLKGINLLCARTDRIKNLLGPKRAAATLIGKVLYLSRAQVEYEYRFGKNLLKNDMFIAFKEHNIWHSPFLINRTLLKVFDLPKSKTLRAVTSRIFYYHLRKDLEERYGGRFSEWEIAEIYKRYQKDPEFYFAFASK